MNRVRLPLPRGLAPMLATAAPPPPDDGRWVAELKWDGYRLLAYAEQGRLTLRSRRDNDITATFPELAGLAAALGGIDALLDGEVVALDPAGRPDFGRLQTRAGLSRPADVTGAAARVPVTYLVFDLLHLDGRRTLELPYDERRGLLATLGLAGPAWSVPPPAPGSPAEALAASRAVGLEGIVAKRRDSTYRPGHRSRDWRKCRHIRRQSAVVVGWNAGQGRRAGGIGSLILALPVPGAPGRWQHIGMVGSGLTERDLDAWAERLRPLVRSTSPLEQALPAGEERAARWVEPRHVVDVDFAAWTADGRLRQPSYQGLRDDLDPAAVGREPEKG